LDFSSATRTCIALLQQAVTSGDGSQVNTQTFADNRAVGHAPRRLTR
jgi:hypothetical protein